MCEKELIGYELVSTKDSIKTMPILKWSVNSFHSIKQLLYCTMLSNIDTLLYAMDKKTLSEDLNDFRKVMKKAQKTFYSTDLDWLEHNFNIPLEIWNLFLERHKLKLVSKHDK